eukprot:2053713-Amphidinium_carterae.1
MEQPIFPTHTALYHAIRCGAWGEGSFFHPPTADRCHLIATIADQPLAFTTKPCLKGADASYKAL